MWEDNLLNEMRRMKRKINRIFDFSDFPKRDLEPENYRHPRADFIENEEDYIIALEIPGVNKEDINVDIVNHTLRIKAEKKQEFEKKQEKEYRYSKSYAGFYRAISLPEDAETEKIDVEYKNGVLKILVPKKKEVKKKKMIMVKQSISKRL